MIDIKKHILLSIEEDIREEDHSGAACIPERAVSRAKLLVKDTGIISGIDIAKSVFNIIDPNLTFNQSISDGTEVKFGDIAFTVEGSARNILKAERLALNYMQRMSGIASTTKIYVEAIKGTNTKILDTRKTSPGLRSFEKQAVIHGGGQNHRYGLYDMIMIKDNHIDFAGGIDEAMNATSNYLATNKLNLKVEVEARDLSEVETILTNGKADRIMFDNFNYEDTRTGVALVGDKMETESSGGITLETIRGYAECGVDYISVGALTHQIKSLDLSLKAF
ncbi:MAG: carboxylating nicotinate-nucleotide diphosphorylase [Salibacteraceae bacterium]